MMRMMVSILRSKQQEMRGIANIILIVRWYLLTVIAIVQIVIEHSVKAISYPNKVYQVQETITTSIALLKATENYLLMNSSNKSLPS